MADYSQEIQDAYDDIEASGATITVMRPATTGTYYAATDSYATRSTTSVSTYGLFTQYQEQYKGRSVIEVGDKQIIIPASGLTFTLRPGDKVRKFGKVMTIKEPNPVEPSGTPIIYKARCGD